jgi:hypothetical protein
MTTVLTVLTVVLCVSQAWLYCSVVTRGKERSVALTKRPGFA